MNRRPVERAARRELLTALRERVGGAEIRDRPRFTSRLDRLAGLRGDDAVFLGQLARLERDVDASVARVEARRAAQLTIAFDPALPITAHRAEIGTALTEHPVLIVCGETGSGKSTQLPKICLAAGRGTAGLIGHTQPRRIAARALADRLASELGVSVGAEVGYQVRFADRTGPRARVKLMTDGILLREIERDPALSRYDTLVIDEAHERTLNVDFLLGFLRQLLPRRPDLRVIITSATIEPARMADHFGGAPIINVSGRSYPVEVRYRPLTAGEDDDPYERTLVEGVTTAVAELTAAREASAGDILVFLPGERQIRECATALERRAPAGTEILPLYARQSAAEQARVFAPHRSRRVVLATNVAETSLTVPGVRCVIDCGLARISRYSTRIRVQRLPVEKVSRASADQRKGRCGREGPGICIRLYSQEDYESREAQTPAEVLRTNLASVILQMTVLGLGDPERFAFLDPPDTRHIGDGYRLLEELGAVGDGRRVTRLGRDMAALPVDPRLARMLLAASRSGCLRDMIVIAAFLSIQDPRERGEERSAADPADGLTPVTDDERSDFVTILSLWNAYHEIAPEASGSALRRWCRAHGLAFLRMREWQDLVTQLSEASDELGLRRNDSPAGYRELHRTILTGLLGQVGVREERREYLGARGNHFVIAPGTPLARRPPRWIVAASLIETSRVYARTVAAVEPAWIEAAAGRLLKRTYSEPHWLEARGYVAAFETVRLYGLVLGSRRRINYGTVDADDARRIFVMHALVLGECRITAPFHQANQDLIRAIEDIEARLRRRDVLVDDAAQADFYLARVPVRISSVAAFERWRLEAERAAPRLLYMSRADLMSRPVDAAELAMFPDTWREDGNEFPLAYRFEPGAPDDGVTMTVPATFVAALDAGRLAWHVAGLQHEKVVAVLRGLPKQLRRKLVPLPDRASSALAELAGRTGFFDELADWLERTTGETVPPESLAGIALPDHLSMNLAVVDNAGRVIASGRELAEVRRRLTNVNDAMTRQADHDDVARSWSFGELPVQQDVARHGMKLTVYPGLQEAGNGVRRIDFPTAAQAHAGLRAGVRRLAMLALPQQWKYARKAFADRRELVLLGSALDLARPLPDLLAERVFRDCFDPDGAAPPRTEAAFLARLETGRARIGEAIDSVASLADTTLRELHGLRQRLASLTASPFRDAVIDIEAQLRRYFPPDFPVSHTERRLVDLPRYLQAVARRLTKLRGAVDRDLRLLHQLAPYLTARDAIERQAAAQGMIGIEELAHLDDMVEEYRVSAFAQELGTAMPVSGKRLDAQLERARAAVHLR